MKKPLTPKRNESLHSSPQINLLMKEEKWIPLFTEEEKALILKSMEEQRKQEYHPDCVYGQWMKRMNGD